MNAKLAKLITIILIISVTVILICWDIYVYIGYKGTGSTISEVILDYALKNPILPFAFGFLMGHLFWPQTKKLDK